METLYGPEAEALAGELAFHFQQGRQSDKALVWTEKAGDQAWEKYATEEAVTYYTQALALAQEVQTGFEQESDLLLKRAKVHLLSGGFDLARANLEQALALARRAGDKARQIQTLLALADCRSQLNEFEATVAVAQEALSMAEACQDERAAGIALRWTGQGLYFQGRHLEARDRAAQACTQLAKAGDLGEQGWAHFVLAEICIALGEFDEARVYLDAARELFADSQCVHGEILNLLLPPRLPFFVGNSPLRHWAVSSEWLS